MDLSDYKLERLREDGEFALYRARQQSNPVAVLVLAPVVGRPAFWSLERLEHEYALASDLDPQWAARPLALVNNQGPLTLVLEDPGGEPLDRLLTRPLELTRFLHIAIALTSALGQVHRQGLIHKDIKPANVLVDAQGHVRLTGFGVASRLTRERQAPAPPEAIAGTLAYMAPEQTGRMNRSVDARSDLYSLGVTFYEMLTGTLPFTASDPMEWVHCHIARQPPPPGERVTGIPEPVAGLVLKLLAKTAEDRYQTAAGVEADLQRCLTAWETQARIDPFALGAHDASNRLLVPETLYGREREIERLLACFERVRERGQAALVLVSGYSGVGKSSVVNELHKALVPPRGLFAAGKFDQYKRDIPYATLAQAFQFLVRQILAKSEAEVEEWRAALLKALGPNGQLIVTLIPELELIIGRQPVVVALPPQDAQNRFQMVLRRFLGVFARADQPLALFLDDLQWLDPATLELIQHLVTHPEMRHLLLVGAYRDNEVGPSHPLMATVSAIRRAGAPIEEILLAPLGAEDVIHLVADALRCEKALAEPLARLVHEKTGGNPFFTNQFFTALADDALLAFDPAVAAWVWDLPRIHTKSFTDNVVDLMTAKLSRMPGATQQALGLLACLGNTAEIATLALVHGGAEAEIHAALWEAVQAGFVLRLTTAYAFLHDRVQEAAYRLIPEEHRAEAHLRIGRVLLTSMASAESAEPLFEVASQFNRGATLLVDPDEKAQVATIDLRAGRKAKSSAAYASAGEYFAAGMALFDEGDWAARYPLMFSLWLERAECEFLSGNLDKAEQLVAALLQRGVSKTDLAAVYRLKILLHVMKSENPQAVNAALTCLRLFNIDIPEHPTLEELQAEYDMVWRNLAERPIESLIDLPLMTDPDMQAAMQVFSVLIGPAYYTDLNLYCFHLCRMVNLSMRHGVSGASAHAYGFFGATLGPVFPGYREGYRFTKLACDLAEKHGFVADKAKIYRSMGMAAPWTQPIMTAIDFMRAAFRAAIEAGDLTSACYSIYQSVAYLLLRNDPLDAAWRESEMALDFVRKARFDDVADIVVSYQRFIANMQGRTATFSTFSDAEFDEAAFEARLTEERMTTMICLYWLLKLKARFLSGDYAEALVAAGKAKALLWAGAARIQLLDYFHYTALTVAALYEAAPAGEQEGWRELLAAHREQLREWAENYPPTFGDKHALLSAEIARLERRDSDAMRFYEQAIQSAREHRFIQDEGMANELAARFYAGRGFETIANAYLAKARDCYRRWGADGKVRQLEEAHPQLREQHPLPPALGSSVDRLDVDTMFKASQALSSEILLGRLIETLMRIAVEHAGAERGVLILLRNNEPQIAAEAATGQGRVEVTLREKPVSGLELPESALHYVIRTRESLILDDASVSALFAEDGYIRQRRPKSVLCLPIITQAKLVGALYLENNLTPRAFTPDRIAVLEFLASQAAISLKNAYLYADLQRSEAFLSEGQRMSHTGSWSWSIASGELIWSTEHYRILGFDPEAEPEPTFTLFLERIHPEDRAFVRQRLEAAIQDGTGFAFDFRIALPDGSTKYLYGVGRPVLTDSGEIQDYIGTTIDITERKHGEDALRDAQAELARAARLATMGELTTLIAHEVSQPLMAIVTNADACLSWLTHANLDEARQAAERVVRNGLRAGGIIKSIRALARKSEPEIAPFDINDAIGEILVLLRGELRRRNVSLETELAEDLEPVMGDRVQLQQVILNLIMNAIEAMSTIGHRPRVLGVRSQRHSTGEVLIAVTDVGIGLDPAKLDRIFDAFFTTKLEGMGMGLAICRTIIEAHGGLIWASPNLPEGSVFQFTVPAKGDRGGSEHAGG